MTTGEALTYRYVLYEEQIYGGDTIRGMVWYRVLRGVVGF